MSPLLTFLQTEHLVLYHAGIGISVLLFWYGGWGLLDTYFMPRQRLLSYWILFFVGIGVLIFTESCNQLL